MPLLIQSATSTTGEPGAFRGFSSLGFLGAYRYRAKWGRVVDAETNRPIRGVTVALLDAEGKPRQQVRTKADGNFVFLVPPGEYQFSATFSGYTLETSPEAVALLPGEQLYSGTPIVVQSALPESETLTPPVVIAMKPTEGAARSTVRPLFQQFRVRAQVLHAQAAVPLLLLSAGLNSVALLQQPTPFLVASEVLYGVLLAMELLVSRIFRRAVGRVRDAVSNSPVALAIVRLVDERNGRIAGTHVTSSGGSFLFQSRPGAYRLSAAHPQYQPYEDRIWVVGGIPRLGKLTFRLQPRSGTAAS